MRKAECREGKKEGGGKNKKESSEGGKEKGRNKKKEVGKETRR